MKFRNKKPVVPCSIISFPLDAENPTREIMFLARQWGQQFCITNQVDICGYKLERFQIKIGDKQTKLCVSAVVKWRRQACSHVRQDNSVDECHGYH